MRIFWTEKTFDQVVRARAESIVREHIGERIALYSCNQEFLIHALAAFHGVGIRHVPPDSKMMPWIASAIRAFGDQLAGASKIETDERPMGEVVVLTERRDEWPAGTALSA